MMAENDVVIGSTTYKVIFARETGVVIFDLLQDCDPRLIPRLVNWHEPVNVSIFSPSNIGGRLVDRCTATRPWFGE